MNIDRDDDRIPLDQQRIGAVVQRFNDYYHWLIEAHIVTFLEGPPSYAALFNKTDLFDNDPNFEALSFTKDQRIPSEYQCASWDKSNVGANIVCVPHPSSEEFKDWRTWDVSWKSPPDYNAGHGHLALPEVLKRIDLEIIECAMGMIQAHALFMRG